jgi:hypothetical protein
VHTVVLLHRSTSPAPHENDASVASRRVASAERSAALHHPGAACVRGVLAAGWSRD